MYWNYRLIRFEDGINNYTELCEVHYSRKTDKPTVYGKITAIIGSDEYEINDILEMMKGAFEKEVLDSSVFENKE